MFFWSVFVTASSGCISPAAFSLSDLLRPDESSALSITSALQNDGLIQINLVNDYILPSLGAQISLSTADAVTTQLPSGVRKTTVAAWGTEPFPLILSEATRIRRSAEMVSSAFASFLGLGLPLQYKDHVHLYEARGNVRGGSGSTDSQGSSDTFPNDPSAQGCRSSPAPTSLSASLPFHIDQGLFLVLTPEDGLSFITRQNKIHVVCPTRTSLLVLVGGGLTHWLGFPLRPCVHGVGEVSSTRSVFARMAFPLDGTTVNPPGISSSRFPLPVEEPPAYTRVSFDHWLATARASPSAWEQEQSQRCQMGEVYCWMECMSADCGAIAVCWDHEESRHCPLDVHTTACRAECPVDGAVSSGVIVADGSGSKGKIRFCKSKTTMYMDGFQWSSGKRKAQDGSGDMPPDCVVLFFQSWVLDSRLKFVIAVIGVFLLSCCLEGIVVIRKRVTQRIGVCGCPCREGSAATTASSSPLRKVAGADCCKAKTTERGNVAACMRNAATGFSSRAIKVLRWIGSKPLVLKATACVLYGFNIGLAYLIMLVAMTFSAELFLAVVAGLTVGHFVWQNEKAAAGYESPEPCCITAPNSVQSKECTCGE